MKNGSSTEVASETDFISRVSSVHGEWSYQTNRATLSLVWLLSGIEAMRVVHGNATNASPYLSYMHRKPYVSDAHSVDLLEREGEVEQMAFKGWVEQVYFIWDSNIRNKLEDCFKETDNHRRRIIAPEIDVMGDFRLIRNDLIHNKGIASDEKTVKCKTLRWFNPGDEIVLGVKHVLDFYNQTGLTSNITAYRDNVVHGWPHLSADAENIQSPNIVSVRTSVDRFSGDGQFFVGVSVVFENGAHINIAIPQERLSGEHAWQEAAQFAETVKTDAAGNLQSREGRIAGRAELYDTALKGHRGELSKVDGLDGGWGPPIKFAE